MSGWAWVALASIGLLLWACTDPVVPPAQPASTASDSRASLADLLGPPLPDRARAQRRLEARLAGTLLLWPGLEQARVHLACSASPWGRALRPDGCQALLVLRPRAGAQPRDLPRAEELQRLLRVASAGSVVSAPELLWVPAVEVGPAVHPPDPAPARSDLRSVGPFWVEAHAAPWARATLALLCSLVVALISVWFVRRVRLRRVGRDAGRWPRQLTT